MPDPDGPAVEIALEPKTQADRERLMVLLKARTDADPTLKWRIDDESGQLTLGGSSEVQLDEVIGDVLNEIAVHVGAPQVAYRETITRSAQIDYVHKRQSGSVGQFARVKIAFEPGEPGSGYRFEAALSGGSIPEEVIPGVRAGIEYARENGLLAGFPVIDFSVRLIEGAYQDIDSSVTAFELAARGAFKCLREEAEPVLLEPIMLVQISAPTPKFGEIRNDLVTRRGRTKSMVEEEGVTAISALVPLSNMFGYRAALRSMTAGAGAYFMTFDHYAPVPRLSPDPLFPMDMGMRA